MRKSDRDRQNKDSTSHYWSQLANNYEKRAYQATEGYPALIIRNKYMMELLQNAGGKVLDIGCGPGYTLLTLLEKGCTVWGVDISEEMVRRARINIEEAGFRKDRFSLSIGDVENLSFPDGMFDSVVCSGVIEYLPDDGRALTELNRVLHVGGELVITFRNKYCMATLFYDLFDRSRLFSPAKRFLKKKLVKRITKSDTPFSTLDEEVMYWKHSPMAFHKKLQKYGFVQKEGAYFHFFIVPVPFDVVFGSFITPISLRLERFSRSRLGLFLAAGYIVRAIKTNSLVR